MGLDFGLIRGHLSLADLIVGTWIGVEIRSRRQVLGRRLIKHNVALVWCEGYNTYNPSARPSIQAFASSFLRFSFGTCTYAMLPKTLKCRRFGFVPKYNSCADTLSPIRFWMYTVS